MKNKKRKPRNDRFNMDVMKETDLLCYLRLKKKKGKNKKSRKNYQRK